MFPMNLRRLFLAAMAALPFSAALPAGAADLHGYTEPLPPLNYEENGEARGFSAELLRAVAARAALSVDIQVLPWPRAVLMAEEDRQSVLFTLTRTAAREGQYRWVGPIAKRRILLFRLAERKDIQVQGPQDIKRLRVAVARESATAKLLQEQGFGEWLEPALNDESSMRMLIAGRVDAVAMLDFAAAWQSARQGPGFKALQPLIALDERHEYYFGLNKNAPDELVNKLQKALDSLRRDGQLEQLTRRYLP